MPSATGEWLAASHWDDAESCIDDFDVLGTRAEAEAVALATLRRELGGDPWRSPFRVQAAAIEAARLRAATS